MSSMKRSRRFISIAVFGLAAGFILGVLTLFIVNVPLEAILKRTGTSQTIVNITMTVVILIWAAVTVAITVFFYRMCFHKKERIKTAVITTTITGVMAIVLMVLLIVSPAGRWFSDQESASTDKSRFTFGSYPDTERLAKLKTDGYEGVIALLSPTIPFENVLIGEEKQAVEKAGLRFYSIPMLPWITENRDSIEQLKKLVGNTKGKYFIHCYLGKHRIDVAKKVVEGELKEIALEEALIFPDRLERGLLYTYADGGKILGPYPTDEEWFSTVLRGRVEEVVSFLDPENPGNVALIEKERKICSDMDIKFTNMPVKNEPGIWTGMAELTGYVQSNRQKVYIHGFKDDERFQMTDRFLRFGTTGTGPEMDEKQRGRVYGVEEGAMPKSMGDRKAFYVTRHILVGAKPSENEMNRLGGLGVVTVILLDEPKAMKSSEKNRIKKACRDNDMVFKEIEFDEDYVSEIAEEAIKDGNPCFVLTPEGAQFQVDHDLNAVILH